jgi:phosphoglycerol transferase MdoB-like AlkP superfamily enzyme
MLRFAALRPWGPLALAFAATLGVETALVERKYGVFGGGFGSSHVLRGAGEWGLFLAGLLLAHALLIGLAWLIVRAAHGRRRRETPVLVLDFLFVAVGGYIAWLAARFEVLSYFSDALSFGLIRDLGGGSLGDALLFIGSEAGLAALGVVAVVILWAAGLRALRRWLPERVAPPPLKWRHLLWPALALPFAAFAADRAPDVRYALARFTAFGLANDALSEASDFDRDGYSWFTPKLDDHPFDSSRHPYALDVPDDGIDQDGVAGDFHFAGGAQAAGPVRLPEHPKHLVLVVLESTRADAIGRVVEGRPVTPVLNAIAAGGSSALEAYSHVGFTTASLKSLFSGRLDPAPGTPSLFRDLKANGYRIGVYSGQPESFGDISAVVGMKASADVFVDAETLKDQRAFDFAAKGSLLVDGRKLLAAFDRTMGDAAGWRRPTFLYWNFQEAHFPYSHPGMPRLLPGEPIPRGKIEAANRGWTSLTYWNAVAYDDWLIGQLIGRLKRLGVWGDTLLVVTADHGESLFDDGFLGHGHVINREQTRVPLILGAKGVRLPAGPIGLYDYRGIVLRALGAAVPEGEAHPVFQHIGPLDSPTAIGMVEAGANFTTFDFETEEVRFGDRGPRVRYDALPPGSAARARADRLFREWERQRWLAKLGRGVLRYGPSPGSVPTQDERRKLNAHPE